MLLSSLLIFSDISSIFMFLADAKQTQRTYQICIICIKYSFEIRTGFMNIHINDK